MEQSKQKQKLEIDKEIEQFIKENSDVLYKRVSQEIGSRQQEGGNEPKRTSDGSFTKHLQSSGMYTFNGLTTVLDKERVINGSKDWMLKLG